MKGVAVTQTQKGNQQQDRHGPPVLQIEVISLNREFIPFEAIISNFLTLFPGTGLQCTV